MLWSAANALWWVLVRRLCYGCQGGAYEDSRPRDIKRHRPRDFIHQQPPSLYSRIPRWAEDHFQILWVNAYVNYYLWSPRSYGDHIQGFKTLEIIYKKATQGIDVTLFEKHHGSSIPLSLQFVYKPSQDFACIHEISTGRNERIEAFYRKLRYGDDETLPAIGILVARIISVINVSEGKIVKVKGFVYRQSQCVIEVVSSFLYRGHFSDYKNTFNTSEEPSYVDLSEQTRMLVSSGSRSGSGGRTSPRHSLLAYLLSSASRRGSHKRIGLHTATSRSLEISSSRTS